MGSLKFIKLAWKQFRERNGFSQYYIGIKERQLLKDFNFTLKYISEAKRDFNLLNWYGRAIEGLLIVYNVEKHHTIKIVF